MSEINTRQLQLMIYDILRDIDACCRKYNITYFLSGGTLLGAVRHKGFIPWDDDGDVMLPRSDYELFFEKFRQEYGDKYGMGSLSTDPDWVIPYGIIWDKATTVRSMNLDQQETGIGVDVFPIDGLSDNIHVRKQFFIRMKLLNAMRNACLRKGYLKDEKHRQLKKAARVICSPFGARFFAEKMDALSAKTKIGSTGKVGSSVAVHYGERETIDLASISSTVYMDFEDTKLAAPVGYDQYLSGLYGDYMVIPEEVKQKGATHLDHWNVSINE